MRVFLKQSQFVLFLLLTNVLFLSNSSYAASGIDWLVSSEVLNAYQSLGETAQPGIPLALNFINSETYLDTENLSRVIIANADAGNDVSVLVADLTTYQNFDGGFGDLPGYDSSAINTAYALKALAIAGLDNVDTIDYATAYLTNRQNVDGSFDLSNENLGSVYITAVVTRALQEFQLIFNVTQQIQAANDFLLSQQVQGGGWATEWESAVALLSVIPATSDSGLYIDAVVKLKNQQLLNGSWADDIFATALALQALHLADNVTFPVEPTTGSFAGLVINQSSGMPVSGAVVTLNELPGVETSTNTDGTFTFDDIAPGTYTFNYSADGYGGASQEATVRAGQIVDLGVIALNQLAVNGLINGIVTDSETGFAVIGASINLSGSTTASTITDGNGAYSFVVQPGTVTIEITAAGFDPAVVTGNVIAGATVVFSPALNPENTVIIDPTVTIKGHVVDGDTSEVLVGVLVVKDGTGESASTDGNGNFEITGLASGDFTVSISLNDYQAIQFNITAQEGSTLDLGVINLFKVQLPTSKTVITGTVTDFDSGLPIEGAEISISGLNVSAESDVAGKYTLSELDGNDFALLADAVGYLSGGIDISIAEAGLVVVNIELARASIGDAGVDIVNLHMETGQTIYEAHSEIEIEAILVNDGAVDKDVIIYAKVLNENGEVVEEFPARIIPLGGDPSSIFVNVPANGMVETEVEWVAGTNLPGAYKIIVQAYDGVTNILVSERSINFEIALTKRIGGGAEFSPPIVQLAAKQPVNISANVSNRGNQPITATTLTANLSLQNFGYVPPVSEITTHNLVVVPEFSGPRGMDIDADGNIYVANSLTNEVFIITPSGDVSVFADNLISPIDVDVKPSGDIYILNQRNSYVHIGNRSEVQTGLSFQNGIEYLQDGRVLIAQRNGLYEVTAAGDVNQIVFDGVSFPRGMAIDSMGVVYIASSSENNISRFFNGQISTFVANINRPYGIAVDGDDNLYVTSLGDNALIKITQDKQVTTVAAGLSSPSDVKIESGGTFLVTNTGTNEVVRVTQAGSITSVTGKTFATPISSVYDSSGNLYIGNNNTRSISKLTPDGVITELVNGITSPKTLLNDSSGGLYVLENGRSISHVDSAGVKTTVATGFSGADGMSKAPDGNGFIVSLTSQSRLIRVDSSGAISTYNEAIFNNPRNVRSALDGTIYQLNTTGELIKINPDATTEIVALGISNPYGLAIDSLGNIFTSDSVNNNVLKVTPAGSVSVFATTTFKPGPLSLTPSGDIIVSELNTNNIFSIDASGTVSSFATISVNVSYDLLVDDQNTLWVSDRSGGRVLKRTVDGNEEIITIGTHPTGLVSNGAGGVYVATTGAIKQIDAMGNVATYASDTRMTGKVTTGIAIDSASRFWVMTTKGVTFRFAADATFETMYAPIAKPRGIATKGDGSILVANFGNNSIVSLAGVSSMPEVVGLGGYFRVAFEPGENTALIANGPSVKRLNLSTGVITDVISGLGDISSIAVANDGSYTVNDRLGNELIFFDGSDNVTGRTLGLLSPDALAIDGSGRVLVSSSLPNSIVELLPDGKLIRFADVNDVEYMHVDPNGDIYAASRRRLTKVASDGSIVSTHTINSSLTGVVRDAQGSLLIASSSEGKIYKHLDGNNFEVVVTGIGTLTDVEENNAGDVSLVDKTRSVVHRLHSDNSTSLQFKDILNAKQIVFNDNNDAFVLHSTNAVTIFNANGDREDLLTSTLSNNVLESIALLDDRSFAALTPRFNTIETITHDPVIPEANPGEVLFTATVPVSELNLNGTTVTLNFGSWTPEIAGDYVVEITADDNSIDGNLMNTIHVGPNSTANLSLSQGSVYPGDTSVSASMSVFGADSTSITRVDADNIILAAESEAVQGGSSGGLAVDTEGNLYVSDRNRIVKIATDGSKSDFVSGVTVSVGLAIDTSDNIYTVNGNNGSKILKISSQGVVTELLSHGWNVRAVTVDENDQVFMIDIRGVLSQVYQDGSVRVIASSGFPDPRALAIDAYGTFYVLVGNHYIVRVSPEGFAERYFDGATFEFEGVNMVADCSNNLMFAPMSIEPFKPKVTEEDMIVQLIGDTGEARMVLYGPPIDIAMADIDVLYYDRFSSKLYMWTDRGNGKVFAFPVICGGIDVSAHIITRSDVDLSSADPAPTSVADLPDGTKQYTWLLSEVDNKGQDIQLNLLFKNMAEDEQRSAFKSAFLEFSNSFDAANPVQVPIDIPGLLASSQVSASILIDATEYTPGSDVGITVDVNNGGDEVFNGTIDMSVRDASGNLVELLPSVAITDLASQTSNTFNNVWNTGNTIAGDYTIVITVSNNNGLVVATDEIIFQVIAGDTDGVPVMSSSCHRLLLFR
jgi:streptogramin lyase